MTTTTETKTYSARSAAIRSARSILALAIKDPTIDVHFRVTQDGDRWAWSEITEAPAAAIAAATAELIDARDIAGHAIRVLPTNPLLLDGTLYPNKGRLEEARRAAAIAEGRRIAGADGERAVKAALAKAPPVRRVSIEDAFKGDLGYGKPRTKAKAVTIPGISGAADALLADEPAPAPKAPRTPKAPAPLSKRAQAMADAEAGNMPAAPDFSAETHKPYRTMHAKLCEAIAAGNPTEIKRILIPTYNSSVVALNRYRELALIALEARKAHAKAA